MCGQHNDDGQNHDAAQSEVILALLRHRADPTLRGQDYGGNLVTPAEWAAQKTRGITPMLLQPVIDAETIVRATQTQAQLKYAYCDAAPSCAFAAYKCHLLCEEGRACPTSGAGDWTHVGHLFRRLGSQPPALILHIMDFVFGVQELRVQMQRVEEAEYLRMKHGLWGGIYGVGGDDTAGAPAEVD